MSKPMSQVDACYHYQCTQGQLTTNKYADEWGWSYYQTDMFIKSIVSWHDLCKINININNNINTNIISTDINTSNNNNTNTKNININNNNINIGGGVGNNNYNYLSLLDTDYPVEQSTQDGLYVYVRNNPHCILLLEYWLSGYIASGNTLEIVLAKDLGVVSSLVRGGNMDKAKQIIDWLWNSDHYRARYLRENKIVMLSSLLNKSVLLSNYEYSKQSTITPSKTPTPTPLPTFDSQGNLITTTNNVEKF